MIKTKIKKMVQATNESDSFLKICRFFMARKGILPRRKRGRASTASTDVDDVNNSPHHRQANNNTLDGDTYTTNNATDQP